MYLLMIIHDFDMIRAAFALRPFKTYSPLIVAVDAALTLTIAFQWLKSVSRQIKIVQ